MPRIAIVGYGRMGRLVDKLAPEYGMEVCAKFASGNNGEGRGLSRESLCGADVAIEFSTPNTAPGNLRRLASLGVNTVTGTTGWFACLQNVREAVELNGTGFVWGPNFSVGLNLFRQIVAEAARKFAVQAEYDAWGWEIHHAAKLDAPSGTLQALAADLQLNGFKREISLSANRAGTHPGTHEIGFDSAADTITIRHTARNREGFARGALRAARWVTGRKGFFEFRDIVSELG
ncbi:MAG: dihydrodipicolinate reductase [Acidobacteriota bacterium]|nr:dihydrodipicolinate reductase [Acidobacteriota bacterium]